MKKSKFSKIIFLASITLLTSICAAALFHPFVSAAVEPATMPSYGEAKMKVADISQHNDSVDSNSDNINFPLLKTQVDAVYIRSFGHTPTSFYIDKQAVNYTKSAQNNGIKFGFYFYFNPTADTGNARSQARLFYSFIKDYGYSCIPALDVETNDSNLTKAQLAADVKAFADEFKSISGLDIMIYSYPYFISQNFDPNFNWGAYKLWIAHYYVSAPMEGISSTWMPPEKWCWSYWDMWQYTSTGILTAVPGSSIGWLDLSRATDNILLAPPTSAAIESISIPETAAAGAYFTAQITVKNTDKVAWTASTKIRLGIFGTAIGNNRVFLPYGVSVAPGTSYTFSYPAKAPASGDLTVTAQMIQEGVTWFGDTKTVSVKAQDASFVSVTAPKALMPGQMQDMTVAVKNTGLSTWTPENAYRLGLPSSAAIVSGSRVSMPAGTKVAPGDTYAYTVHLKAPSVQGTATVNLNMIQDGVGWFGIRKTLLITVKRPTSAQVTSIVLPQTITPGSIFTASITVKNTDSVVWTAADAIRLGISGTAKGSNRMLLPDYVRVAPGKSYTFQYTAKAPASGDLVLTARMLKEGVTWFGDTKTVTIKARDASFVSVTAPKALMPGQMQDMTVTVKNTGLSTWTPENAYRLGLPSSAAIVSGNRVSMPAGTKVAPGDTYTYTVHLKAPSVLGETAVNLNMIQDGTGWFGVRKTVLITVKRPTSAKVTSIVLPQTIAPGSTFTALITVKNTDSVVWTAADGIRLGISGTAKGSNRVLLPADVRVAPGQSYTFSYTAKAPAAGSLSLTARMLQEGVVWFGESMTANKVL